MVNHPHHKRRRFTHRGDKANARWLNGDAVLLLARRRLRVAFRGSGLNSQIDPPVNALTTSTEACSTARARHTPHGAAVTPNPPRGTSAVCIEGRSSCSPHFLHVLAIVSLPEPD